MKIDEARALKVETYKGRHCKYDGSYERFTRNGKCVQCTLYARAVKAGRIVGIDMRGIEKKKMNGVHYD